MSQELLYTSAPRGLKPGSRGFCTVLSTQGMAAPLATALEGLSGYRPIYPAGDERANRNPVVYSHLKLQAAGRTSNVLSRIADFGLDYSQRANKLAHHVVLDKTELLPGGPASLLSMRDFMREEWAGEPKVVALKPVKREGRLASGPCRAWEELTGDAGWAGVLAESFLRDPARLVILLFAPGQDILPLFVEALSLLPAERRWDVTFSTYFTGLAPSTTCVWRALVHDSKEAHESLRFVNALRLDLTSGSLGRATGDALVEAARTGVRPHDAKPRPAPPIGPAEEEFVELEAAHVEFATDEQQAAEIRFAGIPQLPPQLAPGRNSLPTTAAPQPRSGRRLADVIEAESRRPPSRRWLWITLTVVILLIATSFGLAIGTGRVQIGNLFPKPSQQGKALTGQDAPAAAATDAKDQSAAAHSVQPRATNTPEMQAVASSEKSVAETPPGSSPAVVVAETKKDDTKPVPDGRPSTAGDLSTENNAPPILAVQPLRPKVIHASIVPKSDETEPELTQFQGRVLEPPTLHLPSWLQSIKSKRNKPPAIGIEISEKQNEAAGGPFAKIVITVAEKAHPTVVSTVKLKVINAATTQQLGWCVLTVHLKNEKGIDEQHHIALSPFPIEVNPRLRRLKGDSVAHWSIGLPVHSEQAQQPKMYVEQLVIKVGEKKLYSFQPTSKEPMSVVELKCDELSSDVTSLMIGDKEKITATVRIDADSKSKKQPLPTIQINLDKEKKASLLELVRSNLHGRVLDLRRNHEKLLPDLAKAFGALPVGDKADLEQFIKVGKTIDEMIKPVEKDASDSTKEFQADLKNAKQAFTKLHEDVKRHREWVASLSDCEIVAAKISYQIEIPGEDEALTVYIVKFGDPAKDDTKPKSEAEKGANQ